MSGVHRSISVSRARDLIRQRSTEAAALLDSLCRLAALRGEPLYLVGGLVRDLLLADAPSTTALAEPPTALDLDLAVDAETSPYRGAISETTGQRLTRHDRFDTASAILDDGTNLDLARTRAERYPAPGSLPIVEPAPIQVDLQRRDFTVNAAALALTGPQAGRLLDPFEAEADLRRRQIRALHRDSFRDDPTRLIRAARYAARMDARIDRRTLADIRRDRRYLTVLSAGRFGDAWRLLLRDSAATEAVAMARRLRIPQSRDARWSIPRRALTEVRSAEQFWASIGLASADPRLTAWLPGSVALHRSEREALADGVRLRGLRRSIAASRRPSRIAATLSGVCDAALEAAGDRWSGTSGDAVRAYLRRRAQVRSPISARRLLDLGVERGPALGERLRALEAMIWDGELQADDAASVARIEERIRWSR